VRLYGSTSSSGGGKRAHCTCLSGGSSNKNSIKHSSALASFMGLEDMLQQQNDNHQLVDFAG
jgi:hypothetical protein